MQMHQCKRLQEAKKATHDHKVIDFNLLNISLSASSLWNIDLFDFSSTFLSARPAVFSYFKVRQMNARGRSNRIRVERKISI